MLAQYYVFVYIPRTKVEALRKGPSRRDEVRDRAIYRAKERGARYNVEAGGISKAWPHTPAHVYLPIGSRASIGASASSYPLASINISLSTFASIPRVEKSLAASSWIGRIPYENAHPRKVSLYEARGHKKRTKVRTLVLFLCFHSGG